MKKALLITAAAAMTLTGTLAKAQGYGRGYDREDRREYRQERREDRREYRQDRREDRREFRQDRRAYRQWSRGQVLPSQYRTRTYVVTDYNRYDLAPPPRGYQYYRQGDNILLTAIASGVIGAVIASVLGNNSSQSSYGYGQQSYGHQQPYGYQQLYGYGQQRPIRGYDQYGRPYY